VDDHFIGSVDNAVRAHERGELKGLVAVIVAESAWRWLPAAEQERYARYFREHGVELRTDRELDPGTVRLVRNRSPG
jgi:hypothetical protein